MRAKSFRKTFPMLPAIALTAATIALALPARATTFVKDVMLIGGTRAETTTLKNSLTAQGWTFIDYDLNSGASGDYVYLLYKAEENTDGVNRGYVTDFYLREGKGPPASLAYDGRQYNIVPYDGGEWFESHYGDLNSNSSGSYIYLYYTKDLFPDNRAVTSITFNDTSAGAVPWSGNGSAADLNKGCGSDTPYIYMHFTTGTAMTGHQPQASLEVCTAGKYQIAVSGWAYDPDAPAQTIGVQVKIYQSDGTTLYRTENLTANQANANAGVSGNHGFAGTFTNIPAATYKVKLYAIDYNGDGDTQIGTTRTVTVTGTQPSGRIDACTGGAGQITLSGWAYDPDAPAQTIGVQVKIYQSNGTTLYKTENLTANRPRNDVNNTYHITGQHGFSATIAIAVGGTYKVKVYAIDTNGDGNPQIGTTQTVTVTPGVTLTSETGEVTLQNGETLTGTGGANTHVTIAAGATVTLSGVDITGIANDENHPWAGITCSGDATIILADGTTNNVKGGYIYYPGIQVGPSGTTLTIRGSGTLNASSKGDGAGIGGGFNRACGNIVIDGGTITATGGYYAAGIGGAYRGGCGDITITANITSVTASKGGAAYGPYSIGAGSNSYCGTVTIAGIEVGCIGDDVYTFTPADIVSVSFHANGGTGTMGSQTFIKGFSQSLNACTLTAPNDYRFNGWNTKADGSGTAYTYGQSITVSGNITLYAQWKSIVIDLSQVQTESFLGANLFAEVCPCDGDIITGTAANYVVLRIYDGYTVTLRNAHIATTHSYEFVGVIVTEPGILCDGDATIILEGYNYAEGGVERPGILIPQSNGHNMHSNTLTIRGSGSLEAKGGIDAAGIGEMSGCTSGNIVIEGSVTSIVASGNPAIGNDRDSGVTIDGDLINIGNESHKTILNRNMPQTDAADNGYLLGLYNGQGGINVTLNGRTLHKDGAWNTLCLPFNLSAQQVASQLAPTKLMTLGSTSFSGGTLTLQFAAAIDIKAGKPYIIRWDGGDDLVNPTFRDVTVNASAAPVETQYADFIGTFSPVTLEAGDGAALLLGSDGTPAHPAADTTLDAFRAYIRLKNVEPAAVDGYALDFEPAPAYTIRFDANGGSGTMPDQTFILREPQSLAACTFTAPDGDLFYGWNTASDGTGTAFADRASISAIADMTLYAQWFFQPAATVALANGTGEVTLHNGDMLTGTGGRNTHVTIADGATVWLDGVNITKTLGTNWAGIICEGDATIILVGDNAVKGGTRFPGISVPEGKTLTIQGGGSLSATGGFGAAGIGGGMDLSCGNIVIEGGSITATGNDAAGIGTGSGTMFSCGSITIGAGITSLVATGTPCIGWEIDPGTGVTPTIAQELLSEGSLSDGTFTLTPATGYVRWTLENGFSGAWNATDASGVHNVFRYAFNKPTGAITNPPLISISFENGQPVVRTPPLVNTEGYTFSILATDTLDGTGASATYPLNASGRTEIPASDKPARFFRLRAVEQ